MNTTMYLRKIRFGLLKKFSIRDTSEILMEIQEGIDGSNDINEIVTRFGTPKQVIKNYRDELIEISNLARLIRLIIASVLFFYTVIYWINAQVMVDFLQFDILFMFIAPFSVWLLFDADIKFDLIKTKKMKDSFLVLFLSIAVLYSSLVGFYFVWMNGGLRGISIGFVASYFDLLFGFILLICSLRFFKYIRQFWTDGINELHKLIVVSGVLHSALALRATGFNPLESHHILQKFSFALLPLLISLLLYFSVVVIAKSRKQG